CQTALGLGEVRDVVMERELLSLVGDDLAGCGHQISGRRWGRRLWARRWWPLAGWFLIPSQIIGINGPSVNDPSGDEPHRSSGGAYDAPDPGSDDVGGEGTCLPTRWR